MRYSLILASLLLLSSTAFAMCKPAEPPPPANCCVGPCCYDTRWTGFTFGVNAGALLNATDGSVKPTGAFKGDPANNPQRTDSFDMDKWAFVTGVQFGYNYQMKVMVLGVETDFNYCTLDDKHGHRQFGTVLGTFRDRETQLFNWFGTFRGRFGYAFKSAPFLVYGTGGLAYGDIHSRTNVSFSGQGQYEESSSKWRIGYTVGGGIEWGFTDHWSMKTEYLFLQLREHHYTDHNHAPPAFPTFSYHSELETKAHIFRLGFNYTI